MKHSRTILWMHGIACAAIIFSAAAVANAKVTARVAQAAPVDPAVAAENRLIDAVGKAEPAVVSVIITKNVPKIEQYYEEVPLNNNLPNDFENDPFFQNFKIRIPRYRQNGTQTQEVGGGTAFFISSDGLLMTNRHVVADTGADYTVLLNDGRKLKARVLSRDSQNDIALLKVDAHNLPYITLSRDNTLHLAQTAIAIGNALGEFRNTVSVGVISGLQRSITAGTGNGSTEELKEIIQTDAAINPGNSGGPLLNSNGEVIGMNTAIASDAQNIGFALPVSELKRVLSDYNSHRT